MTKNHRVHMEMAGISEQVPSVLPTIGTLIGNYRIEEKIGEGGMGAVYKARHVATGHCVAVKFLSPIVQGEDEADVARGRFQNECEVLGKVSHPNLVGFLDSGTLPDGRFYLMMEYCEGTTLRDYLLQNERLSPQLALEFGRQIASALEAIHSQGIAHRDLNPKNLMVMKDPSARSGFRIKVLDFGIAKFMQGEGRTSTGIRLGTCRYMSPEQWEASKSVDARTDIYSLGLILFEMLTGEFPYQVADGEQNEAKWYDAHVHRSPRSLRSLWSKAPPELSRFVADLLDKHPEYRPTAQDFVKYVESGKRTPSRRGPFGSQHTMSFLLASAMCPGLASVGIQVDKMLFGKPTDSASGARKPPGVFSSAQIADMARKTPLNMAFIPPIAFWQGETENQATEAYKLCVEHNSKSACSEDANKRATQQRWVRLDPFYLDLYEMTNERFVQVLDSLPLDVKKGTDGKIYYPASEMDNRLIFRMGHDGQLGSGLFEEKGQIRVRPSFEKRPMVQVTQFGAALICEKLGKELPTEAQFEAAARGTDGRWFPWGNEWPTCDNANIARADGLFCAKRGAGAFPLDVGSFPKDVSPFGIYDLTGNVLEWTQDSFEAVYTDCGNCRNPVARGGTGPMKQYVARGGSFRFGDDVARATSRSSIPADDQRPSLGFRCMMWATSDRGS